MKNLLACLALFVSISASAQVVYPYNPDANGDSAITSGDLLEFLPLFASVYTPQGITINGVPLDEWLVEQGDPGIDQDTHETHQAAKRGDHRYRPPTHTAKQ